LNLFIRIKITSQIKIEKIPFKIIVVKMAYGSLPDGNKLKEIMQKITVRLAAVTNAALIIFKRRFILL
jgi:hypothetical protein